jgi:hypothetical protein
MCGFRKRFERDAGKDIDKISNYFPPTLKAASRLSYFGAFLQPEGTQNHIFAFLFL